MSETVQLCALCAINPAVNREHVPARALFPKPCPSGLNLIVVPACDVCNGGSSVDDEYLRSYFALRVEDKPSDSLNKVREAATRAFVRPGHRLQEAFARDMSFDWVPEGGGEVLTLQPRITPDMRRVGRVLLKHTRGVFYHVTGRVLPPGAKLLMMPDYKIAQLSEARQRGFQSWAKWSFTGSCGRVGDVFGYALRFKDDDANAFVLSLLYYGTFFYSVMTRPRVLNRGPMSDSWDHATNRLPGT